MNSWNLNTSNLNKFEEFKRLFFEWNHTLKATHFDLKEIDADPLTVVTHKASQLNENILVDDTNLEVQDASIGIHVRWLLDHLTQYIGRKATWNTFLAYHQGDTVFIYKGTIPGTIVEPKGLGYGFDSIFLPEGANQTLGQAKPNHFNARAKAVEALIKGNVFATRPLIKQWEGPWQTL